MLFENKDFRKPNSQRQHFESSHRLPELKNGLHDYLPNTIIPNAKIPNAKIPNAKIPNAIIPNSH